MKIVGHLNVPGRLAASRLEPLRPQPLRLRRDADRQGGARRSPSNWDDELVKATVLTRDGAVVHPNFAAEGRGMSAAQPPQSHGDI